MGLACILASALTSSESCTGHNFRRAVFAVEGWCDEKIKIHIETEYRYTAKAELSCLMIWLFHCL